jgi:hypothetical protein
MPEKIDFNTSLTWDSPLINNELLAETMADIFQIEVEQWAQREISNGADAADIEKATRALLQGGHEINLAGLDLTSLPNVILPSGVLRLDLSDNPQLTIIPARFLSQSPDALIVSEESALSFSDTDTCEETLSEEENSCAATAVKRKATDAVYETGEALQAFASSKRPRLQ